jgi:hypothetical protein
MHRFAIADGAANSEFDDDHAKPTYRRADVPANTWHRLLAGMHSALEVRVRHWWSGPEWDAWFTTADFAVAVQGIDVPDGRSTAFCGYTNAKDRIVFAGLRAARDWHNVFVAHEIGPRPAMVEAEARRVFTELWPRECARWDSGSWWWVREHMVAMAGAFGDETLLPLLARFLEPEYADGKSSRARSAAAACTALAGLTGVELRFDDIGVPLFVPDAALAYRELLRGR